VTGSARPRLIRHFASVDSTNERALAWAGEGAPGGSVVVADEQTAGRGRRGRSWHSPEGGLYLSYIVRGLHQMAQPSVLTLAAGVAAARAIRTAAGLGVRLKWPNDVLMPDAPLKVAGILAEGSGVGGRLEFVVIGVGINVSLASVPPELGGTATSLERELGRAVDRAVLQARLVEELDGVVGALAAGRHAAVLQDWTALAPESRGAVVAWRAGDGPRRGVTAGIHEDGALLVRLLDAAGAAGDGAPGVPTGTLERLVAGEVIWA
jgi:BirA family transcriptional regulator, biotin operon repressor / biotin---[acetyl-CoA-carboxylase] ligase